VIDLTFVSRPLDRQVAEWDVLKPLGFETDHHLIWTRLAVDTPRTPVVVDVFKGIKRDNFLRVLKRELSAKLDHLELTGPGAIDAYVEELVEAMISAAGQAHKLNSKMSRFVDRVPRLLANKKGAADEKLRRQAARASQPEQQQHCMKRRR
jgi:hypothetical protein